MPLENELDWARAIASGEKASPQRVVNGYLFAIRISGAGIASRQALGEVAYRCPIAWTSDEMLARAAGLPVIFGHPVSKTLNGGEYAERNIGTIVFPYAKDNELWGVARIFNSDAAAIMAGGDFSTSPCAICKDGVAVQGTSGNLFVEGDPSHLDHIAIVPEGVWDKGGPISGIRLDSTQESKMADEKIKNPDTATDDQLTKLMVGISALTDLCQSLATRMDAMEKPKVDTASGKTDEENLKAREDAQKTEDLEKAEAQERADSVQQGFGRSAKAPMQGETASAYRVRLARGLQHYSPAWKDIDLSKLPPDALGVAESRIFADAKAEAAKPTDIPVGQLRCVTKTDASGRKIRTFFGDPEACWGEFKIPPRRATFRNVAGIT